MSSIRKFRQHMLLRTPLDHRWLPQDALERYTGSTGCRHLRSTNRAALVWLRRVPLDCWASNCLLWIYISCLRTAIATS